LDWIVPADSGGGCYYDSKGMIVVNVLPLNDWIDHKEDTTCLCEPRIEIINGEMLVVHNALDQREKYERKEMKDKNLPMILWSFSIRQRRRITQGKFGFYKSGVENLQIWYGLQIPCFDFRFVKYLE
jgi:hypothetical protein